MPPTRRVGSDERLVLRSVRVSSPQAARMNPLATDAYDQGGKLLWARVDWSGRFRSYTSCFMWGVKQDLSGGSIADASEHGSSVGKTFFGVPGMTNTFSVKYEAFRTSLTQ